MKLNLQKFGSALRLALVGATLGGVTLASLGQAEGAPFTPGNLVIFRVGDGTQTLVNTGNSVFLDEYTTAGNFVQSVALPTTVIDANRQLIVSGVAASEGGLSRSLDGRYLVLAGYGRNLGGTGSLSGTMATVVPRVIGRVDATGSIDTTTALTNFASGNNPRSATSVDGTSFYGAAGGSTGNLIYAPLGSTSGTIITGTANLRQVSIFPQINSTGTQLYVSTGAGTSRIATVGTGVTTSTGQAITSLPGVTAGTTDTTSQSPYAFVLLDLNPAIPGADTLYVADEMTGGGIIQKFVSNGTTFISQGSVTASSVRGLTAAVNGTSVVLYATSATNSGPLVSSLYAYTDTNAVSSTLSGAATTLVTAGANMALRGIAFAPTALPATAANLKISQFRLGGPGGTADEFIELSNPTGNAVNTSGYTLTAGTGTLTPSTAGLNGLTIPANGHLLLANSGAYSLSGYATPDATYTGDLATNSTLVLSYNGTTVDAVGDLSGIAPTSATSNYAYVRRQESGTPLDTGTDTTDFNLVDVYPADSTTSATPPNSTTGATGVATTLTSPRLGAPGPRNIASPIQRNAQVGLRATTDILSDAKYSSVGTYLDPRGRLTLRRKFTNNTGSAVSTVRFRITAITAGTSTVGDVSDIRALTSGGGTGGGVTLQGLTLDAPSSPTLSSKTFASTPPATGSGNGGGLNSSLSLAIPGGSLASGASVNVEFNFGIIKDGKYRIVVDAELVP